MKTPNRSMELSLTVTTDDKYEDKLPNGNKKALQLELNTL